ncbi:hypothetical protein ACFPH7_01190 [Arcanobacterium bovis]
MKKLTQKFMCSALTLVFTCSTSVIASAEPDLMTLSPSSITGFLSSSPTMTDKEFNTLISRLENLPEDLRNGTSRNVPNYNQRLEAELAGLKVGGNSHGIPPTMPGVTVLASWWQCASEVASAIIQYGVPVGKVLGFLRDAKRIWGGISGIWHALYSGDAARQIGNEGVEILQGILGLDGVINACFG